jgi:hypothetical protein
MLLCVGGASQSVRRALRGILVHADLGEPGKRYFAPASRLGGRLGNCLNISGRRYLLSHGRCTATARADEPMPIAVASSTGTQASGTQAANQLFSSPTARKAAAATQSLQGRQEAGLLRPPFFALRLQRRPSRSQQHRGGALVAQAHGPAISVAMPRRQGGLTRNGATATCVSDAS